MCRDRLRCHLFPGRNKDLIRSPIISNLAVERAINNWISRRKPVRELAIHRKAVITVRDNAGRKQDFKYAHGYKSVNYSTIPLPPPPILVFGNPSVSKFRLLGGKIRRSAPSFS